MGKATEAPPAFHWGAHAAGCTRCQEFATRCVLGALPEDANSRVAKVVTALCHAVVSAPNDASAVTLDADTSIFGPNDPHALCEGSYLIAATLAAANALDLSLSLPHAGQLRCTVRQPAQDAKNGGDKKQAPVTMAAKKPAAIALASKWYCVAKGLSASRHKCKLFETHNKKLVNVRSSTQLKGAKDLVIRLLGDVQPTALPGFPFLHDFTTGDRAVQLRRNAAGDCDVVLTNGGGTFVLVDVRFSESAAADADRSLAWRGDAMKGPEHVEIHTSRIPAVPASPPGSPTAASDAAARASKVQAAFLKANPLAVAALTAKFSDNGLTWTCGPDGEALARAASAAAWSTSPHVSPARSRSLTGEQLPPLAMDRIFADPVAAMAAGSALTSPTAASASALLQQAPTGVARSPKAAGAAAPRPATAVSPPAASKAAAGSAARPASAAAAAAAGKAGAASPVGAKQSSPPAIKAPGAASTALRTAASAPKVADAPVLKAPSAAPLAKSPSAAAPLANALSAVPAAAAGGAVAAKPAAAGQALAKVPSARKSLDGARKSLEGPEAPKARPASAAAASPPAGRIPAPGSKLRAGSASPVSRARSVGGSAEEKNKKKAASPAPAAPETKPEKNENMFSSFARSLGLMR